MERRETLTRRFDRRVAGILTAAVGVYRAARAGSLPRCRFQPTCSQYAVEAWAQFGVLKGTILTLKRLLRCHPWHAGGWDPVPDSSASEGVL